MTSAVATSALSAEQHEVRKRGIGASEIAAVVGVDPRRNRLDVYLEKTGQVPAFEGNEFTLWGTRLEREIADEYARRMKVRIRRSGTLIHPKHPWALCTPDRKVVGSTETGVTEERRGLECKNRNYFDWKKWGEPGSDEVPLEVAAQCHWSMEITGLRRWDVAVLLGGNRLGIYTLRYDAELAAALVEQGYGFWHTYVLPRITPPLDGSDTAREYLNNKWKLHGEGLKDATEEVARVAGELREVRERVDAADDIKKTLENQIKDFIGEQAGVALPDGGKITWKRPKASVKVGWEAVAQGLKSKVEQEEWDILIGLHTTEVPATRRFLCQFSEGK